MLTSMIIEQSIFRKWKQIKLKTLENYLKSHAFKINNLSFFFNIGHIVVLSQCLKNVNWILINYNQNYSTSTETKENDSFEDISNPHFLHIFYRIYQCDAINKI